MSVSESKMFAQQTRLDDNWIITNPEPIKYYISPRITPDDIVFQNNTLHRSTGEVDMDVGNTLRDAELTTHKGRSDLVTDRISLTTPHIRYGDQFDLEYPQESLSLCSNYNKSTGSDGFQSVCGDGQCLRGSGSMNMSRIVNNANVFNEIGDIQNGFGENISMIHKPMDTRLIQYDIAEQNYAHAPLEQSSHQSCNSA